MFPQLIASATRRIPRTYSVLLFFLILSFALPYLFLSPFISTSIIYYRSGSSVYDVYNETLGFEKIIAIGFKERTDKRDAITLASSFTGFNVEWIDGVSAVDVPKKAAPLEWDYQKLSPGSLGCWRAHMNAIEKVVRERIKTALIIEDDADWDIALKSQLHQFATGVRVLQDVPASTQLRSPYGDEWDLFWLGNCQIGAPGYYQPFYVVENDHTVPPVFRRRGKWKQLHVPPEVTSNNTRLTFQAAAGMCTAAYAVTFESAQKILTQLSIHAPPNPIDYGYNDLCGGRGINPFICYASYPSIIGSHRAVGPQSRDSDINSLPDKWHDAYTFDIVYSAKLNLERMAMGMETVTAQWPADAMYEEVPYDSAAPINGYVKYMELEALPETRVKYINIH